MNTENANSQNDRAIPVAAAPDNDSDRVKAGKRNVE
jgi:hypothetical protein